MKKLAAVFVIILVTLIAIFVASLLKITPRNFSDVKTAKIETIDWDEAVYHHERYYRVHVTVTNYETNDVEGLTVSVRDESDGNKTGNTQSIGLIEAGSTKTVIFGGNYSWLRGINVVTLVLNDEIVDEQNYGFSKWLP